MPEKGVAGRRKIGDENNVYHKVNDTYTGVVEMESQQKSPPKWKAFAVRTGLEPVTPCVTGMYSNQLN